MLISKSADRSVVRASSCLRIFERRRTPRTKWWILLSHSVRYEGLLFAVKYHLNMLFKGLRTPEYDI